MFQDETWDDYMPEGSFDSMGQAPEEETTKSLHPAVLAAIAMGCITAFFALITWSLNICILFRRMRKRDEEANEPPGGPTTLEPKPNEHTAITTPLDGSSEGDVEELVPPSTPAARRPEPVENANRVAAGEKHHGQGPQGLPTTLPQTPVVLLGSLAVVLGCMNTVCRSPRDYKPCQE
ncbi:hypothetical protein LZ30DRAFT_379225 [Colletotrichum cereale]|nr:hypothetical protein LZ30DRAFT_379225 [Colletotrichum cereale]